jgi:glycosyltransferase involved in cell wall biosynthesis
MTRDEGRLSRQESLGLLLSAEDSAPELSRYRRAQKLWKSLPIPGVVRGAVTSAIYRLSKGATSMAALEESLQPYRPMLPKPAAQIPPGPVVLSAYLSATSGIGRGGRMSLTALRAAGLDPQLHDLAEASEGWGNHADGGVWFCHCNAPEAAKFIVRSEDAWPYYRVGYWAWELPRLPAEWKTIAGLFHEIWAPSQFVLTALRKALPADGPLLRLVPHPLPEISSVAPDRARFGLGGGVFAFLCMYDVHSSATRKNPLGAIKAFQIAFTPDRADVVLLVKVVAAADSATCMDELTAAVSGWPNIRLITDMLDDHDADVLISSADAFVSLHRSEGFGLSIAQAMALGRPVIVTAWSGNMDFCGAGAALVKYRLIPVRDPHGVYSAYEAPGQVWADPDLRGAGRILRDFADHPAKARALGEAAKRHIELRLPSGYDVDRLRRWIA